MKTETLGGLTTRIAGGTDGEGSGTGPVIVLSHGYGAPGDDLTVFSKVLDAPKGTRWVFPEAPIALESELGVDGRAWWNIDMMALQVAMLEGRPRDFLRDEPAGLTEAREKMLALLNAVPERFGVSTKKVLLGGFSQGAMLAVDVALRSEIELAGLAILSGTFLCEEQWRPRMAARKGMRVFQSHGRRDPLLPVELAEALRDELNAAGLEVTWSAHAGAHEIPPPVVADLRLFIRRLF